MDLLLMWWNIGKGYLGTRTTKGKREVQKCLPNNMVKLLKIHVGENQTSQQPLLPAPSSPPPPSKKKASFHPPEKLAFSGVVLVFMGVLVEIQVENKKENQLL